MLLQYDINEQDRQAFRRFVESMQPAAGSIQTHGIWYGIAVGLILGIPAAYFGLWVFRMACCGVPILVALAWWFGMPYLQDRAVRRLLSSNAVKDGHHSIHLSRAGLYWVGPGSEERWPLAEGVTVQDGPEFLMLVLRAGKFLVVPKRALAGVGGEAALLAKLESVVEGEGGAS